MNHDEQDLRDVLARLGDPPPPPGLDARIWNARQRRVRRAFGIAGIAAASMLVAVTLVLQPRPGTRSPTATTVAAQASPASARDDDVIADIRAIDHALQLAYTRNASEDEVAPLWKARRELLLRLKPSASDSGFI
ncbi:MAG TPA: hypothetical protein VFI26_09725 [Lysobacter sp.]|nr:hypothetical protein [Lysobacter sp.]